MKKIFGKIDYNSPVILSFASISFAVLILNYITLGISNSLLFSVYRSSLINPLTYVRMFTHVLGHMDFEHYMGNMLMILLVGPILEEKYGSKTMIECIAVTAFITGLVNFIFFPGVSLCGASGIVFMMIVMSSVVSVKSGKIPLTLILVVILYLGDQIVAGILDYDDISQLTHIVGGILGGIYGMMLRTEVGK